MAELEQQRPREMSAAWHRNWMLVGLVIIGYAVWNRDVISKDVLIFGVGIFAFATGIMFYGWLRNR